MSEMDRLGELDNATAAPSVSASNWHFSGGAEDRGRFRRYVGPKRGIAIMVLTGGIIGAWYLRRQGVLDPALLQAFVHDHPVAAPLATILIYSLAVLTGLPTLPLNLAAGVFWGAVIGGLISALATTLGAVAAFAAARSIFGRPLARRFDNKAIAHFQREFDEKGWRFIAFVRLNPAFPTGPLNYLLGLTGIDAFTYVWATFVFLLPPSIAVAFMGRSIGTFVVQGHMAHLIIMVMAVSAALTVMVGFAYFARFLYRRGERA
jgi:uncharacterized membrane protein YdjX (TVP38/TMEM64 family)